MRQINEMESVTYFKGKIIMPNDPVDTRHGMMIYSLNTGYDSLAALINNTHPVVKNNGMMYKLYYYDHAALGACLKSPKLSTVRFKVPELKQRRLSDYSRMATACDKVVTPLSTNALRGLNVIYDLQPVSDIIFSNKKFLRFPILDRLKAYFDSVFAMYNKPLESKGITYTKSAIFVDLSEYEIYRKEKKTSQHILFNLLLLLNRSDKILEYFKKDYSFFFYTNDGCFLFNMLADLTKANKTKLIAILRRAGVSSILDEVDIEEKKEIAKSLIQKSSKLNFIGDDEEDVLADSEKLVDELSSKVDTAEDLDDKETLGEIENEILSKDDIQKELRDIANKKRTGQKNATNLKRDQMLREKQKNIKIKTHTISELESDTPEFVPLKTREIQSVATTNHNSKKIKFANFEKTYMETTYERDIVNMFTSVNDKTININVTNVKVEDTSDALNMKETYTVDFEDEYRRRHRIKVDLPIFLDDKFIYINGNKKTIQKQFFAYPVIKTGPDEVQICTNYNKIFIRRYGTKYNPSMEKFKKIIADPKNGIMVKRGDNSTANYKYLTCLEYDELASRYNRIKIGKAEFIFNAELLMEELGNKYTSSLDRTLVGVDSTNRKKEPIWYTKNSEDHQDLISLMLSYASPEIREQFQQMSSGKKFIHTKATVMAKNIPVVVLLCFFEGLSTVVRKFNDPNVRYTDKKGKNDNLMYIKFADGFLSYPMADTEACMMFNGFTEVDTAKLTFTEMDERETYLDIFESLVGTSYIAGALINFYDFMIDPITLEMLKTLDLPEDIVSLTIYANNLLADNDFKSDMDLNIYRLRSNEIVPALLYKQIAISYSRYRQTANNPNPVKMSMAQDAVIKELLNVPTVEDYNELSPMVEIWRGHFASMKGVIGMNLDRAYNAQKRAYDDSMMGVVGLSSDSGPNVGKIRQLVTEPTIVNTRGMIDVHNRETSNELNDTNVFTPIELLTPMSAKDDPPRVAMATKQTSHVVPVDNNCSALISTGMDETIHHRTSNDFSVVAQEDGKVIDYDESVQMMIVQYKSGKKQAIDLSPHVVKNGGGGFYLANQLSSNLKKGNSFKRDDILAYDKKYYRDNGALGNRLTMGSLEKVVCMSSFATYEDSNFQTSKMSKDCATDVTMPKVVIIGKNANVDYMVKVGDKVNTGDTLIRFETSYDESDLNDLLAGVRSDLKEEIVNLGKTNVTSKYTGVITDIVIYSTVEPEQLSPTLRKIVTKYYSDVKKRKKYLDKYDSENKDAVYRMGVLMNKADSPIKAQYGKVEGHDVGEGVLIKFQITYHDEPSDGDKFTSWTANKNTLMYKIPDGYEPYTPFRPYEEISTTIAPSAVLQRGTPSVITTMLMYKVLIETKRRMYEILTGEDFNEVLKRKNPYMVKPNAKVTETFDYSTQRKLNDDEIRIVESVFDLFANGNGYCSQRLYLKNDVVLSMGTDVDYSDMINKFVCDKGKVNVEYDSERNMIVAKDNISLGEQLVLDTSTLL